MLHHVGRMCEWATVCWQALCLHSAENIPGSQKDPQARCQVHIPNDLQTQPATSL